MIPIVVAVKPGKSIKALKQAIPAKIYKLGKEPKDMRNTAIYWGNPGFDKVEQFREFGMRNIPCVPNTNYKPVALEWFDEPGTIVFCRTLTKSHSGKGIVVAENPSQLVNAPLYTKYVKKIHEFRAHCFRGDIFDIQIKKKKTDSPHSLIRSNANGYVFCRDDPETTAKAYTWLKKQTALHSLLFDIASDFTAIDFIYNAHYNVYLLLEINSNPGIDGTTLDNYVKMIKKVYETRVKNYAKLKSLHKAWDPLSDTQLVQGANPATTLGSILTAGGALAAMQSSQKSNSANKIPQMKNPPDSVITTQRLFQKSIENT